MFKEIILPENIKIVSLESKKGIFEISPLYPGYGVTVGNALRRALLSSIKGTAITVAKIEGVLHEFSTLPGVMEDILDITLRLKHVRIKYLGEDPVELELIKKGEGEVLAKDIKCPPGVEVVNKDFSIATLTSKDAELKMKLIIEKGYGYSSAEEREKERVEPGVLFLDAIFSPITNVVYEVENTVYKERADYNLLKLIIETDGTIDPTNALKEALEVLIKHFTVLHEAFSKN
ncbi:MAG: DNA-directed RNA polymerase subunit alpha [Patescibacteria group bacterium]|nr:DNA-directed RNA polymerase subunit alpha [Patescibacteria group bacterium]